MELKDLLANRPLVHGESASPYAMGLDEEILAFIDDHVRDSMHTLETGAGVSTALFAVKGSEHTCVVPSATEIERITAWCAAAGVSTDRITFHAARSEELLPRLAPTELDLVLIDGSHGFPAPFIDWFYAGRRLREGGILIVDDTEVWTGAVLKRFLQEEPGWRLISRVPMRTAVFRRESGGGSREEWVDQPFVVRRSWTHGVRRVIRNGVRFAYLVRRRRWNRLRSGLRLHR
ncbi:MAG TPA: class I SAM-dependent methyltransferase [Solirubrobacteraceae bacterium]|nr:class I SAM-dependent methyltransferase [Solirubrobacteraceae bacterium]